jgi:hypothetical protein
MMQWQIWSVKIGCLTWRRHRTLCNNDLNRMVFGYRT